MTATTKNCTLCTQPKPLDDFHKRKDAKDGRASVCKVCRNSEHKRDRATPETAYKEYKYRASKEGRDFTLSIKDFEDSLSGNCTFCNDRMTAPGLDRIDSSRGYTECNIVPCCTQCNLMKLTSNENKFLDKVFKIVLNYDPPPSALDAMVASMPTDFDRPFEFIRNGRRYVFRVRFLDLGPENE